MISYIWPYQSVHLKLGNARNMMFAAQSADAALSNTKPEIWLVSEMIAICLSGLVSSTDGTFC